MRPHVEFVHEDDLISHPAELPDGTGQAVQRNLSVDEEDGSASLRIDFLTEFERPSGYHAADTEWYLLEGGMTLGDRQLGKGSYLRVPKSIPIPGIKVTKGSQILLFREHGDWGFQRVTPAVETPTRDVIISDTEAMRWEEIRNPETPRGLMLKTLFRDPDSGAYTALAWAKPGWHDERLYHHLGYEECYTLFGRMTYNFGVLVPGTYFFRPPRIKHGDMVSSHDKGCGWLLRSDQELVTYYTVDSQVTGQGIAENYDPETEGPVVTGIPLRTRSVGEWNGLGR